MTRLDRSRTGWPARWTTATGPSSRGWSPRRWTTRCGTDDAPAALELDLSSLRFLDVAGAVGLVHAAEEFPEAHRLSLTGVRPGVLRALDRCGAPFAAQLDVTAHLGVSHGFRCPATQGGRGARVPPPDRAPTAHPAASRPRRLDHRSRVAPNRHNLARRGQQSHAQQNSGSRRGDGPLPGSVPDEGRMRVETTRTAGAVRLRHAVGVTASADDVVARAAPFVAAARGRDEPVALAVAPRPRGRSPPCRPPTDCPAAPPRRSCRCPSRTGRTTRARPSPPGGPESCARSPAGRGGVTVIVEHDPDLDGLDGGFWTELDAALNVALADVAATVLCLYPQLPLHLEVADGARRNHPLVLVDGALRHNPEHRGAREVLADRGGVPAPALLGPPDQRMGFDTWQLVEVRDTVARAAHAAGCDRDRVADLVLAVNEVATNAVEHGSGDAHLALWTGPGSRELLCEVHDGGRLLDPLPGLRAPHPSDPRGRGLWIARQLCDLLHVWGDHAGTHVRIRALP